MATVSNENMAPAETCGSGLNLMPAMRIVGAPQPDAMEVRRQWMKQMGVPDDEINEFCDNAAYPADVRRELQDLEAAKRLNRAHR